ncbi:hypothetical protein M1L60_04870 [Actinoplanes sp. TRM 88003]|uniref:Transposase n=1 Tax=Paractinoplanes aksuensis TaxID=2939490 RepID=A0ABT1DHF4_9ACTN|nr:hypothetical protein [Actinoplanes aksuensis]MCO8269923.1 hypothetical protein [Actinoplanes aksuensis]
MQLVRRRNEHEPPEHPLRHAGGRLGCHGRGPRRELERETLHGRRAFTDEREAWLTSFRWLHRYDTVRRHSRLEQQSPINYEINIRTTPATPASAA